jgi:hypothetical protein
MMRNGHHPALSLLNRPPHARPMMRSAADRTMDAP